MSRRQSWGGRSAQPTWVVATSSWAQIGFVGRNSPLLPLCDDLGLGDDVVAARAGAVAVWSRGHLRRLPAGLIMGMPVRLEPLLRSRLLSPRELLRAGFDFVLPQTRCETDLSIGALIGGRMGRGVVDRLVDPLVWGVYAGSADFLGADAALPGLRERLNGRRSLIRVLRQMDAGPTTSQLVTVRGGLGRLVDALAADVRQRGGQIHTSTTVAILNAVPGGWQITTKSGQIESVDTVVLAAPADAAAELLRSTNRGIATDPGLIPHASVTVASLVHPRNAFAQPPADNGILVPRIEGKLLRACTWVTGKWPHQARDDVVIARCSKGS
jgi:protoporphyrinogen/coproporphyrinogen III oxidase